MKLSIRAFVNNQGAASGFVILCAVVEADIKSKAKCVL